MLSLLPDYVLSLSVSADLVFTDAVQQNDRKVDALLANIPAKLHEKLLASSSLPERCLLVAEYFGHEFEVKFWRVVLYYFRVRSCSAIHEQLTRLAASDGDLRQTACARPFSSEASAARLPGTDPGLVEAVSPADSGVTAASGLMLLLPSSYGLLQDGAAIRQQQSDCLKVHESAMLDHDLRSSTATRNVALGTAALLVGIIFLQLILSWSAPRTAQ